MSLISGLGNQQGQTSEFPQRLVLLADDGPKTWTHELFHRVGVKSGFHGGLSASAACFWLSEQRLQGPHGLGAQPSCSSVGRPSTDCRPAGLQKLQGENDPYPGHHLTLFSLPTRSPRAAQPQSCTAPELFLRALLWSLTLHHHLSLLLFPCS